MKLQTMPKEALAELLMFLAENEEFPQVETLLEDGVGVTQVRAALRELAGELQKEARQEGEISYVAQKDTRLTKETKSIISYLSPGEEKSLLSAFGFIEKSKSVLQAQSIRKVRV